MLPNVADNDGIALCDFADLLDHILHTNQLPFSVAKRVLRLPLPNRLEPVRRVERFNHLDQFLQNFFYISDDRNVDLDVFADGRRVDIDMNLFCFGGKSFGVAGNAVIKSGSNSNKQITIMHRGI